MKARYLPTGEEGTCDKFNVSALSEVYFYGKDWMDTCFIKDIEVFVQATGTWMPLKQAFAEKHAIPDNYNEFFQEPRTPEERERGWY